jgi:hypothetical protein
MEERLEAAGHPVKEAPPAGQNALRGEAKRVLAK